MQKKIKIYRNKEKSNQTKPNFEVNEQIAIEEYFDEEKKVTSKKIHLDQLNKKSVPYLMKIAEEMKIEFDGENNTKQLIINKIVRTSILQENVHVYITGVFEKMTNGYGFLRSSEYSYLQCNDDIYVSHVQVRNFKLKTGDTVFGKIKAPKSNDENFSLARIEQINFLPVSGGLKNRIIFENLTPLYAEEKFSLETTPENYAGRIIDLFAPIGKGQRALIVSPPKAGKTLLLRNIANSIAQNNPESYIIILLIDERPEEVTDTKRNVNAEVISSTFDEPAVKHVQVAEIVLEKAKRLVEAKKDVVILLDSLTRLARSYNQIEKTSGKILSGGVDSNALHRPKRFLGAARNIEEGGSLSIIATALIDTGSRMDEVIFEEFKGTGNMELCLNRNIAERRIFPAVDIVKSGTRREELLLDKDDLVKIFALRNIMSSGNEVDAIQLILDKMKLTKSNNDFLQSMNASK